MQHVCHVVGRDSSAIKFDRVVFLALFRWLKPVTNEGGGGGGGKEEIGVPGENPRQRAPENATY